MSLSGCAAPSSTSVEIGAAAGRSRSTPAGSALRPCGRRPEPCASSRRHRTRTSVLGGSTRLFLSGSASTSRAPPARSRSAAPPLSGSGPADEAANGIVEIAERGDGQRAAPHLRPARGRTNHATSSSSGSRRMDPSTPGVAQRPEMPTPADPAQPGIFSATGSHHSQARQCPTNLAHGAASTSLTTTRSRCLRTLERRAEPSSSGRSLGVVDRVLCSSRYVGQS